MAIVAPCSIFLVLISEFELVSILNRITHPPIAALFWLILVEASHVSRLTDLLSFRIKNPRYRSGIIQIFTPSFS
jgi:hypothetical protein